MARGVGEYVIEIDGSRDFAWQQLCHAVEQEGWTLHDQATETTGNEVKQYKSDQTPLLLGVFRYMDDTFGLLFVAYWHRCVWSGWVKPNQLPEDIAGRIVKRLRGSGLRVQMEEGV